MQIRAHRFLRLISIGFVCLLAGCGSSSSAYIKTINASLDHSIPQPIPSNTPFEISVRTASTAIATNLAYGNATSAYVKVRAGANRAIQISFASVGSSPTPITLDKTLLKNQYYTLIGTANSSGRSVTVLTDDLTPPASGDVKLRLVHEAGTAGPVDIYITAPGVVIDDPKNPVSPAISNFFVGAVSTYLQISAGLYELRATATGNPSNVIIDTLPINLSAGGTYTGVTLDPHTACYPHLACPALAIGPSIFLTQDQPVAGVKPVAPTP